VADECKPLLSERDFEVTHVRIHNESDHPMIVFGLTPCGNSLLTIEGIDAEGQYPVSCADCERMMTGQCECEDCLTATPLWLEPGAGFWQEWEGYVGLDDELPADCGRAGCGGACKRLVHAEAGNYRMTLGVAGPEDCTDPEGEACGCRPTPQGVCLLDPEVEFAEPETLVVEHDVALGRACEGVDIHLR
jgi:hypothetical protein